jgi:hypothetical protein
LTTDLAAGGWPGLVARPRVGGTVAELRAGGAAVTGPGVDANPMTLASTMTTTAVTATQA